MRSPFHPIWGTRGDGGLARSQQASVKAARRLRAKGASKIGSKTETHHVTVFELGLGSRKSAGITRR
jgi:hypothetical protein